MTSKDIDKKLEDMSLDLFSDEAVQQLENKLRDVLRKAELPYTILTLRTLIVGMQMGETADMMGKDPIIKYSGFYRLIKKLRTDAGQ